MDEDEFWAVVASTRAAAKNRVARQPKALHKLLTRRPLGEVLEFRALLRSVTARADTNAMAHAAGLLLGGVGDDSFADFRTWLVCHGRETFERALADPDTVVDLSYDEDEEDFGSAEEFGYVAEDVYEERADAEAPDDEAERGDGFDDGLFDEQTLRARYPRLWTRAEKRHPEYLRHRAATLAQLRTDRA
jgi:hypothetical protein